MTSGIELGMNREVASRSRPRVATRLKLIAKCEAKQYGHRQLIDSDSEIPLSAALSAMFRKADEE